METEVYQCQSCIALVERPVARGQRPKWCDSCRRRGAKRQARCEHCGVTCMVWAKGRFCSRGCANESRRKPKPPPTPKRIPKPKVCRIFTPSCVVCQRVFVTRYTVTTCSPECKEIKRLDDKREGKHRRRALERDAFVAPVSRRKVYDRDGWKCQICMRSVEREAVAPHPLSPTIDHIIPLSLGGTHEPANVRLAHFICNSRRGAAADDVQLALIG